MCAKCSKLMFIYYILEYKPLVFVFKKENNTRRRRSDNEKV